MPKPEMNSQNPEGNHKTFQESAIPFIFSQKPEVFPKSFKEFPKP